MKCQTVSLNIDDNKLNISIIALVEYPTHAHNEIHCLHHLTLFTLYVTYLIGSQLSWFTVVFVNTVMMTINDVINVTTTKSSLWNALKPLAQKLCLHIQ